MGVSGPAVAVATVGAHVEELASTGLAALVIVIIAQHAGAYEMDLSSPLVYGLGGGRVCGWAGGTVGLGLPG